MGEPEFDDPAKQVAWRGYWEGYKLGKGVESVEEVGRRTCVSNFEQWWSLNAE